jgi:hypothetical protein
MADGEDEDRNDDTPSKSIFGGDGAKVEHDDTPSRSIFGGDGYD